MISRVLRYFKKLVARFLGIETLVDRVRVLTEEIDRTGQQSNQRFSESNEQVRLLREQVVLLREQVSALREDVSSMSAAVSNTSANISLVYDCLIEFDQEKRLKGD